MISNCQYPFQCIQYFGGHELGLDDFLIAAAGPKLYTFSAKDGDKVSIWPQETSSHSITRLEVSAGGDNDEPPGKKRRLSPSDPSSGSSTGNPTEGNKNITTPNDNEESTTWTTIPLLIVSPLSPHAIAVTAEDKTLRVFEISNNGTLSQKSKRRLHKRPSALRLTPDSKTIVLCDRFGDVYALPLIPLETSTAPRKAVEEPKPTYPVANDKTVHTKRNLKALQQQLRQKSSSQPAQKAHSEYEHYNNLLGHVSMLTDLAYVSLLSDTSGGRGFREYILTADRDEHIRVSRGPPQTHIIETYCLGHTSFVSSLCVPPSLPDLLISGGGDDYLLVWDWRKGKVLQKLGIDTSKRSDTKEIRIRRIWSTSPPPSSNGQSDKIPIFVAMDGSPQLSYFLLQASGEMTFQESLELAGNILDMVYLKDDSNTIIVSTDGLYQSGSTQTLRNDANTSQTFLQAVTMKWQNDSLVCSLTNTSLVDGINSQGSSLVLGLQDEKSRAKLQKEISETLYSTDIFRKRIHEDGS